MRSKWFLILAFIIAGLLNVFSRCETDKTYSFKLKNNSNILIYYWISYGYPDTLLPANRSITGGINPGDYHFVDSKTPWPEKINQITGDTLQIYIFDADTVNSCSWQSISDEYKILRRIELGKYDIPPLDGAVTYP